MPVSVQIPSMLRSLCKGSTELLVSAETVRLALAEMEANHPAIYHSVCDETGHVRPHVNLFVNSKLIASRTSLDAVLKSGDVLTIMPAVSGG